MKPRKILDRLLTGSLNTSFKDFCKLIEAFGFTLSRIRGSHHIYIHPAIDELVNVQEVGGKAKPYQIRQFLKLIEEYNLELADDGA
jgi:predicted RNA binding protein YcfA (HicA-like mRNA interferase family)